jgi:hypothetical protein
LFTKSLNNFGDSFYIKHTPAQTQEGLRLYAHVAADHSLIPHSKCTGGSAGSRLSKSIRAIGDTTDWAIKSLFECNFESVGSFII